MFKSCWRPRMNNIAVMVLITTPIKATTMMVGAATCDGCPSRSNRLPGDPPNGNQQQQGVKQGGQNRRSAPAVGAIRTWCDFGQRIATPGHQQAEHVAEIMAGIGEQRERIGPQAKAGFDDDKGQIQAHADGKCPAVIVAGVVVMIAFVHVVGRDWASMIVTESYG